MSLIKIKNTCAIFIFLASLTSILAGTDFPEWQDRSRFQADLRAAARVTNIPNHGGGDHFLGLSLSLALFPSGSGENIMVPAARVSLYPNPGYNLWVQFAQWPGDRPAFSVATGIQIEFPAEQRAIRQGLGLSWSEIIGNAYIQRDISAHALYGRSGKSLHYGLMLTLDLQHVIVEDGHGIPDYDETIFQALPYISWMLFETSKVSLSIPMDKDGFALDLSYEWLFGKRE